MIEQRPTATLAPQAPEPFDAYRVLQLLPSAHHDLVEQAYWVLVNQARARGNSTVRLGRLNDAYATLINPERRAAYDLEHGLTKLRTRQRLEMPKRPIFSRRPKYTTRLTHYQLLDVHFDASPEIIDTAYVYRKAVLRGGEPAKIYERALVEQAYATLADPEERASYDAKYAPRFKPAAAVPAPAVAEPAVAPAPPPPAPLRPEIVVEPEVPGHLASAPAAPAEAAPAEAAPAPKKEGGIRRFFHREAAPAADARTVSKSQRALRAEARADVLEAEHRRLAELGLLGDRPEPSAAEQDLPAVGARFRFVHGPQAGEVLPLTDNSVILGSSDAADVVLANPDGMIGAGHVRVWHRDGEYILHQLDSFSTTFVNGERLDLRLAILESGDEIRIGPHTMIFDQTPVEVAAP